MKLSMMGDSLAWVGGADFEVLSEVPAAKSRFIQMALVLLTTAGVAVLSMSLALHDGVHLNWVFAGLFGVLWGLVIFNLDRFLVVSMDAAAGLKQLLLMALPRLAVAAVLALVISTPLVLRVFANDIRPEVQSQQLTQSQIRMGQETKTKEWTERDDIQRRINDYEATLNGKLPVSVTSPQLEDARSKAKTLQDDLTAAETAKNDAYAKWQCELYGQGLTCHGATSTPGPGPLAVQRERDYNDKASSVTELQAKLATANQAVATAEQQVTASQGDALSRAQAEARQSLPGLRDRLSHLNEVIKTQSDAITQADSQNSGILAQ